MLQVSFWALSPSYLQELASSYYEKEVPLSLIVNIQSNALLVAVIPLLSIGLMLRFKVIYLNIRLKTRSISTLLNCFSNFTKLQWVLFLFIFISAIAIRLQMMTLPLIYDEAFTYNQFSSQSYLTILSEYTYPNNQIFHSLLVKVSTSIFGISSEWGVRLPSFISGILILLVAFLIGKLKGGNRLGILFMSVFAYLPILVDYTTLARGYSLVLLFMMLMWLISLHWNAKKVITHNSLVLLFILLGFLSIWTIPLALIPISILAMFLYRNFNWKEVLSIVLPILILGSLIYIPAMTKYGLGIVFTYPSKPESSFSLLFSHHIVHGVKHFYYVFIMDKWYIYIVWSILIVGLVKFKSYFKDYLINVVVSVLFVVMMRIDPPARIWIFCMPFLYLPIVQVIERIVSKAQYRPDLMIGSILLVLSFSVYMSMPHISVMRSFRMEEERDAMVFLKNNKQDVNVIAKFPSESGVRYYQKVSLENEETNTACDVLFINLANGQEREDVISWFYGIKEGEGTFHLNNIKKNEKYLLYEIIEDE